jgi:hypothetical protein
MLDIGGLLISISNLIFKKDHRNFICQSGDVNNPAHSWPDQIDHPNPELNICCFVMYVKCSQTGF